MLAIREVWVAWAWAAASIVSSLSGASMGGMAAWACDPGAYDACTGMHVCQLLSLRSSLIFVFSSSSGASIVGMADWVA